MMILLLRNFFYAFVLRVFLLYYDSILLNIYIVPIVVSLVFLQKTFILFNKNQ